MSNQTAAEFRFPGKRIEGVMGNGRLVATLWPGQLVFRYNPIVAEVRFGLASGGAIRGFDELPVDSEFFPGCVRYVMRADGCVFTLSHTCLPDADVYALVLEVARESGTGAVPDWVLEIRPAGPAEAAADGVRAGPNRVSLCGRLVRAQPAPDGAIRLTVPLTPGAAGRDTACVLLGPEPEVRRAAATAPEQWPARVIAHYLGAGLKLAGPEPDLNRAVEFMKYHMQLGYDWPRTMVCDMFRWRDVWSRDLGSGFGLGALAAGRFDAARNSLRYELQRHSRHAPAGLKVSDDSSQGGSVEGLGFILDLVWRYYLHTGDRELLAQARATLLPWVEMWLARDYDADGLVVDVTEWMDHSRFFRLPEGIQTLYSNVLFAQLAERFAQINRALGFETAAEPYAARAAQTRRQINAQYWNPRGFYNNYRLWDVADEKVDSGANALAILFGLASPERAAAALATLRAHNWRRYGSVTIFPPMKYAGPENDQNVKCWPWWEAKEAKARLLNGDSAGGLQLLKWCTDTLAYERFPGLMEEYLEPDTGEIESFAGHAFITGAGSVLDCIAEGLLGFSVLEPGAAAVRIAPNVPESWRDWAAEFPLADGVLKYTRRDATIQVQLRHPTTRTLQVGLPPGRRIGALILTGAAQTAFRYRDAARGGLAEVDLPEQPAAVSLEITLADGAPETVAAAPAPPPMAPPRDDAPMVVTAAVKTIGLFYEPGVLRLAWEQVNAARTILARAGKETVILDSQGVAEAQPKTVQAVAFVGNIMPWQDTSGRRISERLQAFLDAGGRLVLWGAACEPKGKMGERGSLIEWQTPLPAGAETKSPAIWQYYDEAAGRLAGAPARGGVGYWGVGDYFPGWPLSLGLFGLAEECRGIQFASGPAPLDIPVLNVYTDFACHYPWQFTPLAYTVRVEQWVEGPLPDRYPCAARIRHAQTGGEIILLAPELIAQPVMAEWLGQIL